MLSRLLSILLLLVSACAPRTPIPDPTATPAPAVTATLPPTVVRVVEVSPTAASVPTLAVTSTAATVDAETTARQLRIFEQLWNTVDSQYAYPDFRGVDWLAVYDEFQARIGNGLSDAAFWAAMRDMIDRLDDDHSVFLTPDEARQEDAQLQGDFSYSGIGIYATVDADKRQAVIFNVFPGSGAEAAGLRAHDAILSIDGQPVMNEAGIDILDNLRGPAGTEVTLLVRSPRRAPREVTVERRRIDGALRVTSRLLPVEGSSLRIGYAMVPTLWDATIAGGARQALTELMAGGRLDGLIVDMRTNSGGVSANLLALLGFFTGGQHGEFASRDQTRPLSITAEPIGNSQDVPLVILIGPDTESYAEVFSGVLRDAGRARLVGAASPGNVETIYGYDFEDGSRAWIALETYVPSNGVSWEGAGLIPDVSIDAKWDEFTDEDDPAVAAALELLAESAIAAPP
jgi:C-terminal peptidase prc